MNGRLQKNHFKHYKQLPTKTAVSDAISKDLQRRGFNFVGSTIIYAFMQAIGLINDHVEDCVVRAKVERARKNFRRPER